MSALRLSVQDDGIGMTPEQCTTVFAPFAQADESTTRRFGGTGLGLAIADQLARLMGGHITVASEMGVGTRFTLHVDLKHDNRSAHQRVARPPLDPPAARDPTEQCRVLVAEDNEINQLVARRLLEMLGLTVDVVADGAQAVAAVRDGDYAMVLMDCQMPGTDGYEATAQIRKLDRNAAVPIVAMTASAMPGENERCIAVGMDGFVGKPITLSRMRDAVTPWLPVSPGDDSDEV